MGRGLASDGDYLKLLFLSGDSAKKCKGFCKILWSIEAEIADGCIIFLTGDPVNLGCWEPEMAVVLFPSSERANLWMTEIKVVQIKRLHFICSKILFLCDFTWGMFFLCY